MPDVFISQKNTQEQLHTQSMSSSSHEKTIGLFTSFCENPRGVSFHAQEEDEEVLIFLRSHFITNLSWILTTCVFLLLPLALTVTLNITTTTLISLPPQVITIITLFYYLIVFGFAFTNFLIWFYNVVLITKKEIVDIDFSGLVYHDVAATKLTLVEDVNYTVSGFIRSLFNYGDLFVQTAGGKENIEALRVPQPAKVARLILNLIGRGDTSG